MEKLYNIQQCMSSDSETSPARKKAMILFIDKECLFSTRVMAHVYADLSRDYYVSDDWSVEFYLLQALRGFIAVGHETEGGNDLLLPQLQTSYCVLDWSAIQLGKSAKKQISKVGNYRLKINHAFALVLERIESFHTGKSWLCSEYKKLCLELNSHGTWTVDGIVRRAEVDFRLCSVELWNEKDELVAGELGYIAGSVYTALTGFCERKKNMSLGTIQILALAKLLERNGFAFMNMGQPPVGNQMVYKHELGGIDLDRPEFIEKWYRGISNRPDEFHQLAHADVCLDDIFSLR